MRSRYAPANETRAVNPRTGLPIYIRNRKRARDKTPAPSSRKQSIQVEDIHGNVLATGSLYPDGNVQLNWRESIGYTAEQYSSLAQMFGVERGSHCIRRTFQETDDAHD